MPLPIMLEEEDRKVYEALQPPKTIVCRYGYMRMVAELPYDGEAKPGCGSKLVIRSPRGVELAEMLTSTCPNAGCSKSVTRKEMLQYIENSGGKDYPFTKQGKVVRVATVDDLNEQSQLDNRKSEIIQFTKALIRETDLKMQLVDVELLLGGDRVIFHYTSEQWVDFRELVRRLASEYQTRIEMHQVNARDEARLVADYEKCGQHCCCKQFLKVLKPVSMRSAKTQKATLDPTKISGRCGRLMCCLRYEDQTYESLKKLLPHKQTRVMTTDGPGTVLDSQILTQLVLIRTDQTPSVAAYPVEDIRKLTKEEDAEIKQKQAEQQAAAAARSSGPRRGQGPQASKGYRGQSKPGPAQPSAAASRDATKTMDARDGTRPPEAKAAESAEATGSGNKDDAAPRRKRRRRNRRGRRRGGNNEGGTPPPPSGPAGGE